MGYTHYFRQQRGATTREWRQITERFKTLLECLPQVRGRQAIRDAIADACPFDDYVSYELIVGDADGNIGSEPLINGNAIMFNGVGANVFHEPLFDEAMVLKRMPSIDELDGDWSCQTGRKPYDLVVCGLLLVAAKEAPGAWRIGSDGGPTEWEAARQWVVHCFGADYPPALFATWRRKRMRLVSHA